MRLLSVAVAFSLLVVPLVGCIGTQDDTDGADEAPSEELTADAIEEEDVQVPDEAELQEIEDGYRLAWEEVQTPFQQEIELPENTVGVTAHVEAEADVPVWVNVTRVETGVERCPPG